MQRTQQQQQKNHEYSIRKIYRNIHTIIYMTALNKLKCWRKHYAQHDYYYFVYQQQKLQYISEKNINYREIVI